jgi:hypothetical protein
MTPRSSIALVVMFLLVVASPASAGKQLRGAMLTPNWSAQGTPFEMTPAQQQAEIAAVARMGGNVVRLHVDWARLQSDGGIDVTYQSQLDQAVASAHQYRQAVILNIIGTPCWASLTPSCPVTAETHMDAPRSDAFGEITSYLLNRYPGLYGYEVWNEPNCCGGPRPTVPDFWHGTPADFAQIVNAAVRGRNAVGSRTRVIVGGFLLDGGGFLEDAYRAGMRGHDGISIHPYSLAASGWVNPSKPSNPFHRSIRIARKIMLRYGDRSGIYITEYGFAPCPADTCIPPRLAGRWLALGFREAAKYRYVKAMALFSLRDYADPADPQPDWQNHSGILGRPAYGQVRRMLKQLRNKKHPKGSKKRKKKRAKKRGKALEGAGLSE